MTTPPELERCAGSAVPAVPTVIPHPRPGLFSVQVGPGEMPPGTEGIDHVSNTRLLAWIDRAAELHGAESGQSRAELQARERAWFVRRHEVDYCAEVMLGDAITVATWVRDVGRTRSWRDTVMFRPGDATVVVSASTCWVYMDLARRRPTRIDAATAARLDPLHASETQACTSR